MEPENSEYSNFGHSASLSGERIIVGQPNLQIDNEMRGGASLFVPLEDAAFTVTPQVIAGLGTTSPDEPQVVPYGDSVSFVLLPEPGYHVAEVTTDCPGGDLQNETFLVPEVGGNCSYSGGVELRPTGAAVERTGGE